MLIPYISLSVDPELWARFWLDLMFQSGTEEFVNAPFIRGWSCMIDRSWQNPRTKYFDLLFLRVIWYSLKSGQKSTLDSCVCIVCYAVSSATFTRLEAEGVPASSPSRGGDVAACVFNISQPSSPAPFYSLLVSVSVFMALSTVFHSINSPENSPLSHSVLPVSFLPYESFQLYISLRKSLSALI